MTNSPDSSAAFFFTDLDARIARYDLLQHPFYTAWSRGELTPRRSARVRQRVLAPRLPPFRPISALCTRSCPTASCAVLYLSNLADGGGHARRNPATATSGWTSPAAWAPTSPVRARELAPQTSTLIQHFRTAMNQSPVAALAALYAYESRVPAIAKTKVEGLGAALCPALRRRRADLPLLHRAHHRRRLPLTYLGGCAHRGAGRASRADRGLAHRRRGRSPHPVVHARRHRVRPSGSHDLPPRDRIAQSCASPHRRSLLSVACAASAPAQRRRAAAGDLALSTISPRLAAIPPKSLARPRSSRRPWAKPSPSTASTPRSSSTCIRSPATPLGPGR